MCVATDETHCAWDRMPMEDGSNGRIGGMDRYVVCSTAPLSSSDTMCKHVFMHSDSSLIPIRDTRHSRVGEGKGCIARHRHTRQ